MLTLFRRMDPVNTHTVYATSTLTAIIMKQVNEVQKCGEQKKRVSPPPLPYSKPSTTMMTMPMILTKNSFPAEKKRNCDHRRVG